MVDMDCAESLESAELRLEKVAGLSGRFFVPNYQRGYRWGPHEVLCLLQDILESGGQDYNLQPVVVAKRKDDERWELIDGQQRLTTLFLIYTYIQREWLPKAKPPFSIEYQTRPGSESYLRELDEDRRTTNIDFHHIYQAYECIAEWFAGQEHPLQAAIDFHGYFVKSVSVLWYQAPSDVRAETLFRRLNVGRIPLTDAELVKALLLSRVRRKDPRSERAQQIAAQWDAIERDLARPEVWAFVSDTEHEKSATRISLLLDALAGKHEGKKRPRFFTFEKLRPRLEDSPVEAWDDIVDLHALAMGWFDDRSTYHKVGYLIAVGHHFADLVEAAKGLGRTGLEKCLDERIRASLKLTPLGVAGLSYEDHRDKCERLLLLMNVESVRRAAGSSERYSFTEHRKGTWSLEHIHAQQAESLTKVEQWQEWLSSHQTALLDLPTPDKEARDALVARIEGVKPNVTRQVFREIQPQIAAFFSLAEAQDGMSANSTHSISNLALLKTRNNSALSNATFEVKRQEILRLDRDGEYIPICTRRVFLKYYTQVNAQQIHFWGMQDRKAYLNAMIDPVCGLLTPYLGQDEEEDE